MIQLWYVIDYTIMTYCDPGKTICVLVVVFLLCCHWVVVIVVLLCSCCLVIVFLLLWCYYVVVVLLFCCCFFRCASISWIGFVPTYVRFFGISIYEISGVMKITITTFKVIQPYKLTTLQPKRLKILQLFNHTT